MTVNTNLPCDVVAAKVQFNNGMASITVTPALRLSKSLEDSICCLFAISVMCTLLAVYTCNCTAFCTDTVVAEDVVWEDEPGASRIVAIRLVRCSVLDRP